MIYRKIYNSLKKWKISKSRLPLLLRGARQIGKTYVIEAFARAEFDDYHSINFELNPEYKTCFTQLDPKMILQRITLLSKKELMPGKMLLFLDEIQECPRAIESLRYFKEQCPDLHVIGAGSLLEFALNSDDFKMPVGRVEFLYMYPLTFSEFLLALDEKYLVQYLAELTIFSSVDEVAHNKLLELLKLYFVIGGMPAVIDAHIKGESLQRCQTLQASLLNTYRNDFSKYASTVNQQHCRRIFDKAPLLVAQHFKYVDIDPDIQSRALKAALHLLFQAGLIIPVYEAQANSLLLNTSINEKKFKILFLDIGFVKYASKLDADILMQNDLLTVNRGAIAEQFVGQELIALQADYREAELYFWVRNKKSSMAEIDYLMQFGQNIVPIEVKAGKAGRLKSLQQFMQEKKTPMGIKISQDKLNFDGKILSLPLYMIEHLERLMNEG